jgi:YbbR domain-containing protein
MKPIPSIISHNFWLKFFSIALATVIWLAIHYGIRSEFSVGQLNINNLLAQEYIRVPVAVVASPGDMRHFKISPSEVVVIAVGEKTGLQKAAQKSIRAYVDLTRLPPGQSAVEEVHAEVPPDINVLEVSPATVTVDEVVR